LGAGEGDEFVPLSARWPRVPSVQIESRGDVATSGRQRLIWQLLNDALSTVATESQPAVVLDCGGGSGTFAVPLAQVGAQVTVVDVSVDALATLRRRADEVGVADRVQALQGDVETLTDTVGDSRFDLVLAHGVLGEVDQLAAAFAAISAAVRPGGLLSVLVSNPAAGVLARALSGDLSSALTELRGLDVDTHRPTPDGIRALCGVNGLVVEAVHGIGVFTELVPGASLDAPGALEDLAQLEAETATRRPFADIASRVHVLARRPIA
jgi:S-adenosylmethionine-dependent methyltransferase